MWVKLPLFTHMYERRLTAVIQQSKRSILLLGPRQVGKSTLLASLEPDLSINLARPSIFRDYVTYPERLEAELNALPQTKQTIFIDEIQRIPPLLDLIQVLMDQDPGRVPVFPVGLQCPQTQARTSQPPPRAHPRAPLAPAPDP